MATQQLRRLMNWWSIHPIVDWAFLPALFLLSTLAPEITSEALLAGFLGGVSAMAGLTFAIETFVCGRTYSSAAEGVRVIRDELFPRETRHTWASVLIGTLVSSATSLLAMLAIPDSPGIALSLSFTALGMTLLLFLRAAYWLVIVLRAEVLSRRIDLTRITFP